MSPTHKHLPPLVVTPDVQRNRFIERIAKRYRSHQQISESSSSEAKTTPYTPQTFRETQSEHHLI